MKIFTESPEGVTVIQNSFIDQYMPHANGEFVKVYLYLLRCANTGRELSLSSIADVFEHTENDVRRAVTYWEKQGLLRTQEKIGGELTAVTFIEPSSVFATDSPAQGVRSRAAQTGGQPIKYQARAAYPDSDSYRQSGAGCQTGAAYTGNGSCQQAGQPGADSGALTRNTASAADSRLSGASQREQKELRQLFFIAEQYLQRPITSSEQSDFIYYYDTLHFSADLIEYLLEYCISKGSGSRHYMRKVALAWAEAGITTVLQAKQESNLYNKNYFTILNAFGIKGRNPAPVEQEVMARWLEELAFPIDIILEACRRTVVQTHQPNFQYADKILSQWHKSGVKSMADIEELDRKRIQEQKKAAAKPQKATGNRFNNFKQRDYDYSQLERQLLNQ